MDFGLFLVSMGLLYRPSSSSPHMLPSSSTKTCWSGLSPLAAGLASAMAVAKLMINCGLNLSRDEKHWVKKWAKLRNMGKKYSDCHVCTQKVSNISHRKMLDC